MDWTEILVEVNVSDADLAGDIAQMVVTGGIYVEDYSHLEQEAREIARIDLIDEELLKKDRIKAVVHIYISPEENPAEAVGFLSERYTAAHITHTIHTKLCRNEDWENNWKQHFKPLDIGEKLYIRPLWVDDYDAKGRTVLNIEPGVSFGTGTHETTRLCLEAIEQQLGTKKCDGFLDIGCGSGILSVAALLLGALSAVAVDIDSLAVKMALENGRLNGFDAPRYTVLNGNLTDKVTGTFDIIAANIVADAIIALSQEVKRFMNPGAVFITSGIIDLRENDVLKAFNECELEVVERYKQGGWLCFVTKQKEL